MKDKTSDGKKLAVGAQRMSYDAARNEMKRNGWENVTEEMTLVYSYVGKKHFSGLMERAAATGDIEMEYLERATGRKLAGTPASREIHLYRRANLCAKVLELILKEVKENLNERSYLGICNADNEEEMTRDVFESHRTIDPEIYIETLDRKFRQIEGREKEFGCLYPSNEELRWLIDEGVLK